LRRSDTIGLSINKQKSMPKLKKLKIFHRSSLSTWNALRSAALIVLSVVVAGGIAIAHADQFNSQINTLQNQNDQTQSILDSLTAQATSYQSAISLLQSQINALQSAIQVNETKQAQLQQQIITNQQVINQKKAQLGATIKAMYIDGQTTTIEELATSQNLSAYVDKEEYRQTVQDQLNSAITEIGVLEAQLQQQKQQLDIVVSTEQHQNQQIVSAQTQQQQMLSYNQGQQAAYNQQIQDNDSQIATLVAEQIAANRKLVGTGTVDFSGTCGGSYPATAQGYYGPWGCNYAHSSDDVPGCTYLDSWGMCNRECVSYTAWMVYKNDGIDVTGFGNANQWPANARADGIPMGTTPRVGSVAIYMGGSSDPFGHAMWVKSVSSDGSTITVDQYNLYYDGNFYETTIPSAGLVYIYF
jgi:surface antigen